MTMCLRLALIVLLAGSVTGEAVRGQIFCIGKWIGWANAVHTIHAQDPPPDHRRTVLVWRTSPPSNVLVDGFRRLGAPLPEARQLADFALAMMGIAPDQWYTDHPKYGTSSGVEMLTDALRGIGIGHDDAPVLASLLAAEMGMDPNFDEAQLQKRREQVNGQPKLSELPLDGVHAESFLKKIHDGFTAIGYLDREADSCVETLRDRWNLRGDATRHADVPVLDWRRSNLHLLLTDAFVEAAGHSREDARQLAYNAMVQHEMGIAEASFDRHGQTSDVYAATARFEHDPRGATYRRVYVFYADNAPPDDLRLNVVINDLAATVVLDRQTPEPVLAIVHRIPRQSIIRR